MYIGSNGAMVPLISYEKSVGYKENKLGIVFTDKYITYKREKQTKSQKLTLIKSVLSAV